MMWKKCGRCLLAVSLSLLTIATACAPPQGVDRIAIPYTQQTVEDHIGSILGKIRDGLQSSPQARPPANQEVGVVEEYFTLAAEVYRLSREVGNVRTQSAHTLEALTSQLDWAQQRHDELKGQVEGIISRQVGEALSEAGLQVALGPTGPDLFFPPSEFFLLQPPFVLVTSPRDRIEISGSYLLSPDLNTADMDKVERQAESGGNVSALVERTGGFSLYPAWVSDSDTLRDTLDIVAHEWTHAYLFMFYPLGRSYFKDYDMRTINETVADMVGHEVGRTVYNRYYSAADQPASAASANAIKAREADFTTQIRRISSAVQGMLAQGQIDQAEAYMEAQRQDLVSRGYAIRRLNQAYLALHGSYADTTGIEAPVAPIGKMLKDLRARSSSLGDFVRTVGNVSSYGDLEKLGNNTSR